MLNEDPFITLVTKKLAGEASPQELQQLDTLLQADEHLRERYTILQQYFAETAQRSSSNADQALQRTLADPAIRCSHAPVPLQRTAAP